VSHAPGVLRYVNILQGTDSHFGLSKGNTLPLTALPFGMNHWCPQTGDGDWFFSPRHHKFYGMRATHQPSPWMGDYGQFLVMAQTGPCAPSAWHRGAAYRPDKSDFKPHYFRAELIRYRATLEMTPTVRGAVFRFTFPAGTPSRVIWEGERGECFVRVREDCRTIEGYTRGNRGGAPEGFAHYFVATFDRPIEGVTHFQGRTTLEGEGEPATGPLGVAVEFGESGGEVTMRLATSFISIEQAERNLSLEIGEASFDEIRDRAAAEWEATLGKIVVEDENEDRLRTFYSCLYRTQLFPRVWHEPDAEGNLVHYSPYDGQVHPGVLYTDNGFWDTYRTVYPLFSLLMPERLADILQGWVNACKEGGWFPQWATPGYRACMVGTHIDAVMADAVVRGVTGFDVEAALDGMLRHAYEPGDPAGAFGRIGIQDYNALGYVASDHHHESVARSLDYAYDDFCISQVAALLGRVDEAEALRARAQNYRHLYDSNVGFMRGRNGDGSWREPFGEFLWGDPYVEGGPWQSSWAVPHDPAGLIALNGGDEAFATKLDTLLTTPPYFEVGSYNFEIHEMTEMASADWGQYAHSNQPVHHVLYLYNAAGRPWRTQQEVRRAMTTLYDPDGFAGDEDNGEMSAWYVLSALGFFPLCPGHPSWTLGSPLFKRATLTLGDGREWVVEAPENTDENVYVAGVTVNGEAWTSSSLPHEIVSAGGKVAFAMSAEPNKTATLTRPFSCTPY